MSQSPSDAGARLLRNMRATMLFSLVQKALMFALNFLVLSEVAPQTLGKVCVQLEFLLSSSLFLAREGVRMACLRHVRGPGSDQAIVRASWLVLPVSLLLSGALSLWLLRGDLLQGEDYALVLMYAASTVLENLAEPVFNLCQHHLCVQPRLRAEMAAVLAKSVLCFACMRILGLGTVSFGVAQLGYGAVYALVLVVSARPLLSSLSDSEGKDDSNENKQAVKAHPKHSIARKLSFYPSFSLGNTDLLRSSLFFSGSSVVKHALTEADKIALSFLSSPHEQGVYAFVNNYASILARLVYFPIEDNLRGVLSRLAAEHRTDGDLSPTGKLAIRSVFVKALLVVGLLGMTIAAFGPSFVIVFSPLFLRNQWNSDVVVHAFSWFCTYLFVLGLNGTSEACLSAVVRERDVWRTNVGLILSSITFFLSANMITNAHSALVVIQANILAMAIRTTWNLFCVDDLLNVFSKDSLSKSTAAFMLALGFASHLLATWWGEETRSHKLAYLSGIAPLGIVFLFAFYVLLPGQEKNILKTSIGLAIAKKID